MPVTAHTELFRKGVYEIGKVRQLTREFVCVLGDATLTGSPITESEVATAVGVDIGTTHPTYANYRIRKLTITEGYEGSPYHVHLLAEYGVVLANEFIAPVDRVASWEFDGAAGQIAALRYYHGSGNNDVRPLVNSAYDYFEGLVADESLIAMRVSKNFASLPSSWITSQNFVNSSTYLGCPAHSVKVAKVSVAPTQEEFAGVIVPYWKAVAELHYRQSGHSYQLPDVGWNFISGGQRRRAMVFDFENGEWVASSNPVGLDGAGNQTLGAPAVLVRRMNPETDFAALFGQPPTIPPGI